jgi:3-isopropylmalate/(R)-2-methylmalate dehydratase small subunit
LEELTTHVFDDIAPGFSQKISKGDVIVAGKNFGLGSSREHAPLIIKMAGIDAIVAESFARIFYRNAINVGLAAIICTADDIAEGNQLEIRLDEGVLVDKTSGNRKVFSPLPAIMRDILNEGGLDHYIKKYGALKV